jgi:hypothetical protein
MMVAGERLMDDPAPPPAQPLFDLTGMSASDARDYVLSLTAHLKQAEGELAAADEEVKLWANRIVLADEKGLADLRAQAEAQRVSAVDKRTKLELEVWEFRDGVEKLKKQLLLLPLTQRTVNTDALLENLAKLGGPLDEVTPVTRQAQADDALAALKKRLAEGK